MRLTYDNFEELLGYETEDRLLVRNLFAGGGEREKSCRDFLAASVFEDLDHESIHLMPYFLLHNGDSPLTAKLRPRINGLFKWSMCRNSFNLSGILPLLKAYDHAGIPILLMKGVVLAHTYYKSLGMRFMADVDIAVPPENFDKAAALADAMGFQRREAGHSIDFCKDGKYRIDLHRTIFKESYRRENLEQALWEKAQKIKFYDLEVFVPAPEDLLLSLLLNEFFDIVGHEEKKGGRNKQWLLDVKMVLAAVKNFDREYFVGNCYRLRVMPQVIAMLETYRRLTGDSLEKLGAPAIFEILSREEGYNEGRMRLFGHMAECLKKNFCFHYQKIYCTYCYITAKTPGEGIDLSGCKEYLYERYCVETLPGYLKAEARQLAGRLKRMAGGSA